jgi:hypothetical protein
MGVKVGLLPLEKNMDCVEIRVGLLRSTCRPKGEEVTGGYSVLNYLKLVVNIYPTCFNN